MEKIFLTGATGFIGANLSLQLARTGNIVHALCRSNANVSLLLHPNIRLFYGDITHKADIEKSMKGCTKVYHLAAYAKVWAKNTQFYYDINVQGTKNVLDVARQLNIEKTVVTSTAGIYGHSFENIHTEDSHRNNCCYTPYEKTKLLSEILSKEYADRYNMNIVIVNPTRVYGHGMLTESNTVTKIIKNYLQGKWHFIPGNGNTIGNYVFVDDVVSGCMLAMEKGTAGDNYLLGGENVSYNDFFDILKNVSHKNYSLYKIPLPLMLVYAHFQQVVALVGKQPSITPAWVKKYNCNAAFSSQKAIDELNYKITALADGIKQTIIWLNT